MASTITRLTIPRAEGPWQCPGGLCEPFELSGLCPWQSNGGTNRGHPARSLPFTLEIDLGEISGEITRIHFVGVFALFADRVEESVGTLGASVHLLEGREIVFRQDLLNGRHYEGALNQPELDRLNGDGTSVRTVGDVESEDGTLRVDLLSIDIPEGISADSARFKDLGSPASFLIYDVFVESSEPAGCPFHSRGGGISLSEIPALVRVGDRVRFAKALDQLEDSIRLAEDLDEGRGQALTFLALTTSALLEMGGRRELHRFQLDAARRFEEVTTADELADVARTLADDVTAPIFRPIQSPSSYLVDKALQLVERNYARDLNDSGIATQLGLSTSHFRFLFREATGQPFHKYLIAVRLEKARQMLMRQDLPVSEVAKAVGFGGLSHFSRAFAQRFSVSPTHLRRGVD